MHPAKSLSENCSPRNFPTGFKGSSPASFRLFILVLAGHHSLMAREYVLHEFRSPVDLHIDYARELNPQQYAAVTAAPGPALVIAGAGAGKTRTLTYRVAYLLEQGIAPDRILLLTFTNKAAQEMMQRVANLIGGELSALWGGTFHSVGHRLLRRHADLIGYRTDFTILDSEDAEHLLKTCLGEADIDIKATRFPKARVLASIFSLATNTHRSIRQVLKEHYDYFAHLEEPIGELYQRYQQRKRADNVMDFDDLLVYWLVLMREHSEVGTRYQRQFQFILVDEYQDTNQLQSDLIDLLAALHQNVMAVGDDAQSIYAWRGANYRNIFGFPERYPAAQIYKIETNYRSTPEVLAVANAIIAPNARQYPKVLRPARQSGAKPILVVCGGSQDQAVFVAQRVLELREEGVALHQMAVLYRSHYHALELQMELTRRNIPFTITSGIRFFEQAHIKDVVAHLKWVSNPQDELAFKRAVQLLPGIGAKGADRLWQRARAAGVAADDGGIGACLAACRPAVPKKTAAPWQQMTEVFSQISASAVRGRPGEMIQIVLAGYYEDYLQDHYQNYRSRLEDLQQLAAFSGQFKGLEDFLGQLSLLTNVEAEGDARRRDDEGKLRLSTIHQAKGLEYDVVFVVMLCQGLFPIGRAMENAEQMEEERRLFYVAATRARNELYLSYPLLRAGGGYGGLAMQQPSLFLSDIPTDLLEQWNVQSCQPVY